MNIYPEQMYNFLGGTEQKRGYLIATYEKEGRAIHAFAIEGAEEGKDIVKTIDGGTWEEYCKDQAFAMELLYDLFSDR